VRDGDHRAGEAHQELLQPFDRFGVEMVGRFVEQQHVRLREQQLAQRDAPLLATRELADQCVPGWQAQRVGSEFELAVEVRSGARDDRFEAGLFLGQLVEIGVRLGVGGVDLFEPGLRLKGFAETGLDFLADGLLGSSCGSCGR
jgi:hypothetical protein